jgi:hypothetical protein
MSVVITWWLGVVQQCRGANYFEISSFGDCQLIS